MLSLLMGSELKADVLMLMLRSGPVYCHEIAETFGRQLSAVQYHIRQLRAMGTILGFFAHGRYYYDLNPGYYLSGELQDLLEKHLGSLPSAKQRAYCLSPDGKRRQNLLEGVSGKGYLGPVAAKQEEPEVAAEPIEVPGEGAPPGAWGAYYRAKVEADIAAAKRRMAAMEASGR